MSKPQTQSEKILQHMRNGSSITALDALNLYGCFRLAARIKDLKNDGWTIKARPCKTPGGATIAEYWMPAYLTLSTKRKHAKRKQANLNL